MRSYLLRPVAARRADGAGVSLMTLDAVNVLDMLGFSPGDAQGAGDGPHQPLASQQMRRNFAHSVAPPTTSHAATKRTSSTSSSSSRPSEDSQEQVLVQSHEQQPASSSSEGLRERKPQGGQAAHPTFYINNQRI